MTGTRWLRRFVLAHALLLCCCMARAQLKLGSNPATINKSSILELESIRQGLLLPRIPDTTVATLTTAPDGTLIYFTGNNSLMIRKNGFWRRIADTVNFWQNAGAAGGDLTGTYPNPAIAAGVVTYNKIQNVSASSLTGRYAGTAGTMQEITLGTGLSFSGSVLNATAAGTAGGDLTGTYPNPSIAPNAVTYSKIQPVTAGTILGRYTTGSGSGIVQEISLGSGLSLNNSTGVLSASATGTAGGDLTGTYPNPTIASGVVTYSKIQNVSASSLLGRYAGTAGTTQEITLGTGLSFTGSVLNAAPAGTAGGDLTGTYPNPAINANAVTYAKFQQLSTNNRILGRYTAGAGNVQEITLGTGLSFTGSTLNATAAGTAGGDLTGTYPNPAINTNAVTYAKMQQVSANNKILGRYTAGTGNVQELTLGTGLSLNTTDGTLSTTGWLQGGNTVASEQTLGTLNAFALPFITSSAERMRISSAGLVGINTTSPSSTLHVRSGTTDASGLRLENLINTSAVTSAATAIGVDGSGNVVRAPVPVYYTGGDGSTAATVGAIRKVWMTDVANTATGIVSVTIPSNVAFGTIVSIQVTAKGVGAAGDITTAPIATISSNTLTSISIRVVESRTTNILILSSVEGLEAHTSTSTRIYVRVEGF